MIIIIISVAQRGTQTAIQKREWRKKMRLERKVGKTKYKYANHFSVLEGKFLL